MSELIMDKRVEALEKHFTDLQNQLLVLSKSVLDLQMAVKQQSESSIATVKLLSSLADRTNEAITKTLVIARSMAARVTSLENRGDLPEGTKIQ